LFHHHTGVVVGHSNAAFHCTMSLNTIKDHKHDLERVEKDEYAELNGVKTKLVCTDTDCDYFISQWEDSKQASISTF